MERTAPRSMSARPALPPTPTSSSTSTPPSHRHSDCDIVKRGSLYVKHPPSVFPTSLSIQPWKKRYVILRDTWHAPSATTTLDIYDSEPRNSSSSSNDGIDCRSTSPNTSSSSPSSSSVSGWLGGTPYSIDLRDVTAVGIYLESRRFQFAFYVQRRDDRTFIFAAESDLDVRCWVAAVRTLANKAQCSNGVSSSTVDGVISLPNRSWKNVSRLPTAADRPSDVPGSRPALARPDSRDLPQIIGSGGSPHLAVVDTRRRQLHLSAPQLDSVRVVVQQKSKKFTVEEFGHRRSSSRDELATTKCAVRHERFPSTPEGSVSNNNNNNSSSCSSCPDHHPLRRLFSASIFGRASGRWRPFSKSHRKDSGFSDSFDDSTISSAVSTGSFATTTTASGSSSSTVSTPDSTAPDASVDFPSDASDEGGANPSRFGPPPKLPPRRATVCDETWTTGSSSPVLLRPPPPPRPTPAPVERSVERRGNVERSGGDVPPVPPPRPAYTLTHFSASTRRTVVH